MSATIGAIEADLRVLNAVESLTDDHVRRYASVGGHPHGLTVDRIRDAINELREAERVLTGAHEEVSA